jgi:hypothetical protein
MAQGWAAAPLSIRYSTSASRQAREGRPVFRRFIALIVTAIIIANQLCPTVYAIATDPNFDENFYSGNDILFYDPRCQSNTATGYVTLSGKDNLEKILKFFMDKGLTLAQASGFAGNFMAESGLDPTIIQGGGHAAPGSGFTPKSGVGFGLAQWTSGGRQQGLVAETQRLGVDITDLGGQLAFAWKEINESYPSTLVALKAADDPVQAAVAVHDGYESSADSKAAVINNRGGNATKFYTSYADAPALTGATTTQSLSNPSTPGSKPSPTTNGNCTAEGFGNGNLQQMVTKYAWSQYVRGSSATLAEANGQTIQASDQTPAYAAAIATALGEGRYVGGTAVKGDDCGGFVSVLMYDSGFDKTYNSNDRGGPTTSQQAWMEENWQRLSPQQQADAADRQPGDVAINSQHTYVFIGDIPGFGEFDPGAQNHTSIASASVSGPVRAPMAGRESAVDPDFTWYRIKTNLAAAPL